MKEYSKFDKFELKVGDSVVFNKYKVKDKIGETDFSTVYSITNTSNTKAHLRAIKIVIDILIRKEKRRKNHKLQEKFLLFRIFLVKIIILLVFQSFMNLEQILSIITWS